MSEERKREKGCFFIRRGFLKVSWLMRDVRGMRRERK